MADSSSDFSAPSSSPKTNPSSSDANPQSSPSSSKHWIPLIAKSKFFQSIPVTIRSIWNDKLDEIFSNYANGLIETAEFELAVLKLIKEVPAALDAFKKLFSTANFIPTPRKGKMVFKRQSSSFNDKVRAGLYDDTKNYMKWLRHLLKFKKGSESYPEFKKNVEVLLADMEMEDLWKEFDAEFAPGGDDVDVEKLNKGFTSLGRPSNSSDQEPASKRNRAK